MVPDDGLTLIHDTVLDVFQDRGVSVRLLDAMLKVTVCAGEVGLAVETL